MLFVLAVFSGCSQRELIVPKEVYITVPCVIPKIECVRTPPMLKLMEDKDIIIELVRCIAVYEENIQVCQ